MSEKSFDYYKSTPDIGASFLAEYAPIRAGRDDIIRETLKSVPEAVNLTEYTEFGQVTKLQYFVFPVNSPILKEKHMTSLGNVGLGEAARGKMNTKEGAAFNRVITEANKKLVDFPTLNDFIISKLDAMRTGFGIPAIGARGTPMLSSSAGTSARKNVNNILLLRVPNKKSSQDTKHREFKTPKGWKKITYGQFYDLASDD
jgi:hypothetical protein